MIYTILILAGFSAGTFLFMRTEVFGGTISGERKKRILNSPNFFKGSFQNLSETPMSAEGMNFFKIAWKFFTTKVENGAPPFPLPSVKRRLASPSTSKPVITWFGHSGYMIQALGKTILVDPVFSRKPSPVSFAGSPRFKGTDIFDAEDLPPVDICIISHDHYDHLDYELIKKIHPRVKHFITSLGVGAHLERWNVDKQKITELDWHENTSRDGFTITAAPARHFSGRRMKRNSTLWSSFILKGNGTNIYLGGDSGYDSHFKEIGEKHGPFDIALLECGQYNTMWPYIHMLPEETVQAAKDVKADVLMPVHWGTFRLAMHPWNEPIERVVAAAAKENMKITTPMIGEEVVVGEKYPASEWYRMS